MKTKATRFALGDRYTINCRAWRSSIFQVIVFENEITTPLAYLENHRSQDQQVIKTTAD